MTVTVSCRNHTAVCQFGILDMEVGYVRLKYFICVKGVFTRLNEVGKIEDCLEIVTITTFRQNSS